MSSLLHAILEMLLFVFLVVGAVSVFARVLSAAFPHSGSSSRSTGGGRTKALRSPAPRAVRTAGRSAIAAAAHPTNGQIRTQARADARRAWTEVKATDWLEQQRHARANGTTATTPTLRQRLRLAPFVPAAATGAGGNGTNGVSGTNGTTQPTGTNGVSGTNGTAPVNGTQGPAPPPKTTTPAPTSTTGGTTVAAGTSTASADKLTEAINQIYAHAASGGLTAKQEAVRAMHEAAVRFAGMTQMLSRTMSEPGSNYGPEITEPLGRAGTQFQAGAMLLSEADNALETLANMTLREVAQSPRQAPDKSELAESGRH